MGDQPSDVTWSGARLTGLRKRRGYTQVDLAGRLLLTRGMVIRYEKGQTIPSSQRWQQIATALNVHFLDLAKRYEDPHADLRDAQLNGPNPHLGDGP